MTKATRASGPTASADLELTAASVPEFLALMRKIKDRSGRTAGQLAKYGRLPRSTVYNFVAEKNAALPRKPEQVQRFCRGCRLTDAQTAQVMRLWENLNETNTRKPESEALLPSVIDLSEIRDEVRKMLLQQQAEGPTRLGRIQPATEGVAGTSRFVYGFPHEVGSEGTYYFSREQAGFERGLGAALTIVLMAFLTHLTKWMFSNLPFWGAFYLTFILGVLQLAWIRLISRVWNHEQDARPRRKLLAAIPAACVCTAVATPFVGPFAGSCFGLVVASLVFPFIRERLPDTWLDFWRASREVLMLVALLVPIFIAVEVVAIGLTVGSPGVAVVGGFGVLGGFGILASLGRRVRGRRQRIPGADSFVRRVRWWACGLRRLRRARRRG
ncbi:hypothetical protein [Nocardia brasiliensis]|uniref:hypothetical protein n=1 Tax=Nocardia brasiliensis TaxID=37326 RepID=UPI002457A9A8|nr:hypothetical protein [Nocardia brasiliensis]